MTIPSGPELPVPRGQLSAAVIGALRADKREALRRHDVNLERVDLLSDDDAQLALACVMSSTTDPSPASKITGNGNPSCWPCAPNSNGLSSVGWRRRSELCDRSRPML